MSNTAGEGDPPRWKGDSLTLVLRWARSWKLGLLLMVVALAFVFVAWRDADFSGLTAAGWGSIAASAMAYGVAVLLMAAAVIENTSSKSSTSLAAGLSTQLFKYVPGTIWQGQRILASDGVSGIGRFAGVVLIAAALGLGASGRGVSIAIALIVGAVVLGLTWRSSGQSAAARVVGLGLGVAIGISLSGAALGAGLGMEAGQVGREIAGAWGLGVLIVPVPAGIGVRELYLSLGATSDATAQLAIAHRSMTLVIDVAFGLLGVLITRASGQSPNQTDEQG